MNMHPHEKPIRHILSLSGGKDSTALAIYMRNRVPEMEYIFCDTGDELQETYEYLDKLKIFLGKPIERLNPLRPFNHHLKIFGGVLPDARARWCTRKLKIEPFEEYIGDDVCYSYVGIRADEPHRKGYISTKSNIVARYPFIDDGLKKEDVFRILEESGLGLPDYYQWRSRSGCYFCFFQQKIEWIGLLEKHPNLYQKAMQYEMEKENVVTGERYTWNQYESLKEMMRPERVLEIKNEYIQRSLKQAPKTDQTLKQIFSKPIEVNNEDGDEGCLICHL